MGRQRSILVGISAILIVACSCPLVGSTAIPTTEAPTAAPQATATEAALVPSETPATLPTTAVTLAASGPVAAPAGQPVNCRSGPGLSWDVTTILQPGQTADIVAQTSDGGWVQVKPPAGGLCWMSTSVVTITGALGGVQVVQAPPTPTGLPTSAVGAVTNVQVSVSPKTISVAGCMGPIQPSTVMATITVNGPVKLVWHFEDQLRGNLGKQVQNFSKAGSKYVSSTFTPPLKAGTWRVELFIDGVNLKGFDSVDTYKISC